MKTVPLSLLKPGSTASVDFYSEKGELLISRGAVISERYLELLSKRNLFELFVRPATEEEELGHLLSFSGNIKKLDDLDLPGDGHRKRALPSEQAAVPRFFGISDVLPGKTGLQQLSQSAIARKLDEDLHKAEVPDRPIGQPIKNKIIQIKVSERSDSYKSTVSLSYEKALDEISGLLKLLAGSKGAADAKDVEFIVKQFVKIFVTDHNILLNISGIKPAEGDYLFHHSLNVCLLAINIAASSGYNERQVLEIGMGALVHDIGMLLIPESIRTKPSRLTKDEWFEVQKHPILGLHLLEKLKNMPDRIAFIAYQVHERENATGYPRQRNGLRIHRFAKMVQVADIYEALISPRPHRPPLLPVEAVDKLLQMAKKGMIPMETVMALLEYISLFPVGSFVVLGDRRIAKVISANKEKLHRPVVSVLFDEQGNRIEKRKIYQLDLSQNPGLKIVRNMPYNALTDVPIMEGF